MESPAPKRDYTEIGRWLLASVLVGVAAGLVAIVFYFLLEKATEFFTHTLAGFVPPNPAGEGKLEPVPLTPHWRIVAVPALGGLIAGLLYFLLSRDAQGSGTDKVIEAFHRMRGTLETRMPIVKGITGVVVIGSGGSVGREGPIVLLGAWVGQAMHRFFRGLGVDRRTMMLGGAAGGFGSIFRAPLSGAVFATEVLYRNPDFEYEAFISCLVSSITAFATFGIYSGFKPLFAVPAYVLESPSELLLFAAFGIVCAIAGILYVNTLYFARGKIFDKIPMPGVLLPALGGALLGGLVLIVPEVWGTGYGWIQRALDGNLVPAEFEPWRGILFLLGLAAAKTLATALTYGSRGGEGVFGPTFFVGGLVGAAFAGVAKIVFPETVSHPASFVLCGMGGVFAGVTKVPIAGLLMVCEISGSYGLLLPMILVASISYALTGKFSVYRSQVPSRADSPVHRGEFVRDVLEGIRVEEVWNKNAGVETVPRDTPLAALLERIPKSTNSYFPVVDDAGKMVGILTIHNLRQVLYEREAANLLIAEDLMTSDVVTVTPEEPLNEVIRKFSLIRVEQLPIVDPADSTRVLGFLSHQEVLDAYNRRLRKFLAK